MLVSVLRLPAYATVLHVRRHCRFVICVRIASRSALPNPGDPTNSSTQPLQASSPRELSILCFGRRGFALSAVRPVATAGIESESTFSVRAYEHDGCRPRPRYIKQPRALFWYNHRIGPRVFSHAKSAFQRLFLPRTTDALPPDAPHCSTRHATPAEPCSAIRRRQRACRRYWIH